MQNSNELSYPPYSYQTTHIGRLGAIGRIFGLDTQPSPTSRVLELGCANAINLLAMAQLYPGGEFIGIDYSIKQIEWANKARKDADINNARFICADVSTLDHEPLGQFDYIIAHGIFSWVPKHVQKIILEISKSRLSKNGVVYIDHNCMPGWGMRGAMREMMLMHTDGIKDIKKKVVQARALIKFLADSSSNQTPYGNYLHQEFAILSNMDDSNIAHDFLEEDNTPLYFNDIVTAAAEQNLVYLGDADASTMVIDNLPETAANTLKELNLNLLATEQYMDFMRNRMFRSTLFCHADSELDRTVNSPRLLGLEVTSMITLKEPSGKNDSIVFLNLNGDEITVNDPLTSELLTQVASLGRNSKPCDELFESVVTTLLSKFEIKDEEVVKSDIGRILLNGYFKKMVDLTVGPVSVRRSTTINPEALPLARWQASKGLKVSTPRLDMIDADQFVGKFITLCDGSRDREALIDAMAESLGKQEFILNENNKRITDSNRARKVIETIYSGVLSNLIQFGIILPGTSIEN
jgi:methyltransferase-like protein/ubiquinone/menaquinone biosynthesis C-methylase UbiE